MKTSRAFPQRNASPLLRSTPFIVILGGVRSGKSRFAVALAKQFGRHIVYVATCQPGDREMRARIARHRRERPAHWRTLEPSSMMPRALERLTGKVSGVLVDDLTMWMAGLLRQTTSEARVLQHVTRFCETLHRLPVPVILVTNDVGSGVVPPSRLGRRFRDLAGLTNQIATRFADDVYLLVAGIPLHLKEHP